MPITSITGPFCQELFSTYIAHETDTAEINVPIMMEDGENVILPEDATTGNSNTECLVEEVCCNEPEYFLFVNESQTVIGYGSEMIARHGQDPSVFTFYYDTDAEEGGLLSSVGVYTKIAFDTIPLTKITVTHGGPASGVIKIV